MKSSCKELNISEDLKTYISFLKHRRLDKVIIDSIRLSGDYQLPFFKQLERQPQEVIYQLFYVGINQFFEDILQETPVQGVIKQVFQWKDKIVASEISSLTLDDIVSGYTIRKQVLISYIHDFSTDPLMYINLVQELTNIVCVLEKTAIESLGLPQTSN